MNSRNKLYLTVAAILLLLLALLLWPSERKPVRSAGSEERARPVNRPPRIASPPAPRRSKDFRSLAKLAAKDELPKLTRQEIDHYLEAQHRNAGSLLAAYRLSGDDAFLHEAMEKFRNNPQVLLASLQLFSDPATRLEILDSLKRADPENGIADCLSARALFDLGKNNEAVAELSQSVGKPIRDYTALSGQNVEEAYLAAGFSPVEAKATSLYQSTKTLLLQMRNVADGLKKQRASDESAGDDAAVQSSRDIQMRMAGELQEGGFIVDSLVAMALEKGVLREIDSPEARARMEEMELQKKSMVDQAHRVSALLENADVSESDWLLYFDRAKLFGENAANEWLLEKHPDL